MILGQGLENLTPNEFSLLSSFRVRERPPMGLRPPLAETRAAPRPSHVASTTPRAGITDAGAAGMLDLDRAALRNIVIAVPVCTALLIGTAYLALEWAVPAPNAATAPPPRRDVPPAPVGTTTTLAEPPGALEPRQTPPPAPRSKTPAPAPTETERPGAPSTPPPSPSSPVDVTKMNPGSLNLPGSGPFTPAPYVPPPPDWVPPPGWTFVPPQPLLLDAGAAERPRRAE